ncbi:MAG: BMP family ABC transporter substrate-binding protein [Eubacteriaceae bacterium]|jgi:basic membrane protein A|nr:BMP family ABC transporter substrate-binding protein [Eubacteriaceae bacterium]
MKRIIAILLCMSLILTCFSACGIKRPGQKKVTVVFLTDSSGFSSEDDTNKQIKDALEGLKKSAGIVPTYKEGKDKESYVSNLRELAESKEYDVILTVGYAMSRAVDNVAKEYPEQLFVTIDYPVNKDNVLSIVFREEESAFYSGVLAALMTKTNKVGFVSSFEGQNMSHLYGFLLGIRAVDPNIAVEIVYTHSYTDLSTGTAAAEKLKAAGVDVLYSCAAAPTSALVDYAKENKMLVINSDIYKYDSTDKALISETSKKYKSSVEYIINAAIEVTKDGEGAKRGGISTESRYAGIAQNAFEFSFSSNVPKDIRGKLEAVKIMFANSEIVVPTDDAGYTNFDLSIFEGKAFKK